MKSQSYFCPFLLILFVIIVNSCNSKNNNQVEDNYKKEIEKAIIRIERENNSRKVKNQYMYFGTDSTIKIELKQFLSTKRLFLYFSSNTCSPCIERTVEIIKEVLPSYIKNEKIVFLSPDYPARFRNNFYGKKLLMLENRKLGIPIENEESPPFFIIVNYDMEVESIHVVNKMDFDRTVDYLKEMTKNFDFK